MGTFEELRIGESYVSPSRAVTDADISRIIEVGGYTHPLFTDDSYLESSRFDARPLPGEGALLMLGGLVEETGLFDDTVIALAGFSSVEFVSPVTAGDEISVRIEPLTKQERSSVNVMELRWTLLAGDQVRVRAIGTMLFSR